MIDTTTHHLQDLSAQADLSALVDKRGFCFYFDQSSNTTFLIIGYYLIAFIYHDLLDFTMRLR